MQVALHVAESAIGRLWNGNDMSKFRWKKTCKSIYIGCPATSLVFSVHRVPLICIYPTTFAKCEFLHGLLLN